MRSLKLKEVSEMVFLYMRDNQVNLTDAYEAVSVVLNKANPYTFETVKKYLFDNDMTYLIK